MKLRPLVLCAALATTGVVAAPLAHAQQPAAHSTDVTLSVGETKLVAAANVKNYAPTGDCFDVKPTPDGTQFIITGRRPGSGSLLLIKNDGAQTTYDINVSTRNIAQVERELQQLLGDSPGVRLRRVGGKLFIDGSVSTDSEAKRIDAIAKQYKDQAESLVVVAGPMPGDRKVLVRLDLFFVRYERSSSWAVGIGYPTSIGGTSSGATQIIQSQLDFDFITGTMTSAQASIVGQPLPRLDIGARNGWAKVLKQSTLITGNGVEATFFDGGELNFKVSTAVSASVAKIEYGSHVKMLPRYDSSTKDIEVKIASDVSELAPNNGGELPGRTATRLETTVNLKLGQALVLSGFKTMSRRNDIQGLPLLSEIPVLGVFFGSHSKQESESEGAIFIIPSVVETVPKSSLEVVRNALTTYKNFSGSMQNLDTFPVTPPSAN